MDSQILDTLFVFPVNITQDGGNVTHVKNIINRINSPSENIITYKYTSRIKNSLQIRYNLYKKLLSSSVKKVYIRYYIGMFIEILILKLLNKKIFIELNAVISEEAIELKYNILIKKIIKIDEFIIKNLSNCLICVTPEICNYYDKNKIKSIIIENCVDTELFNPKIDEINITELSNNHFNVGFVGTFSPWQDIDLLIYSIIKLKKSFNNITLHLVGFGVDFERLEKIIKENNSNEFIKLHGKIEYKMVPYYIQKFDICVVPLKGSRLKNTGSSALKFFEYLSMNKPVLISECGTLSEKFTKLELCFSFSDSIDFENRLKYFIVNQNKLKYNYSRDYIIQNHSWDSKINTLRKLLK